MSIETPQLTDLENAKKFPWQWAVIVLMGVVGALYGVNTMQGKKNDANCEESQLKSRAEITKKDSIIFDWQSKYITLSNELLYKNNILDRQQSVIDKTDSVTRNKLEKSAKQIVKSHEQ